MLFITAADKKMSCHLDNCINSLKTFGYNYSVYDLGGLNYGIPWIVKESDTHYQLPKTEDDFEGHIRISKSLFKPSVVSDARNKYPNETLVWIDADTILKKPFNVDSDFDIAVADRPLSELGFELSGMFAEQDRIGRYNAGMIIFNPTDNANQFISDWCRLTEEIKNDQIALNQLIKKSQLKIKILPYHYNSPKDIERTVLYHLKDRKHRN